MNLLERRRNLFLQNQISAPIIPPNGVYILSIDNKYYKENEWVQSNDNAVGVAVITDDCKFVISPEDGGYQTWGAYGTVISNIKTTADVSQAKLDYKGNDNTTHIISQASDADAAKYCRNYTFKNGKKGYLPALGEWQVAYDNKTAVDACMNKIGGKAIHIYEYHWSSTQHSSNNAWLFAWRRSYLANDRKNNSSIIRVFAAF